MPNIYESAGEDPAVLEKALEMKRAEIKAYLIATAAYIASIAILIAQKGEFIDATDAKVLAFVDFFICGASAESLLKSQSIRKKGLVVYNQVLQRLSAREEKMNETSTSEDMHE